MTRRLLGLGRATLWLVVASALSLAGAGLVAELSHPPGTAARAELTYAGDRVLRAALADATTDLEAIAADVARLGVLGRGSIAALVAADETTLRETIDAGSVLALTIEIDSNDLDAALVALPGDDPNDALRYADGLVDRRATIRVALERTAGLAFAWARLTDGSLDAARLVSLLVDHDTIVATAAAAGRERRYDDALATLAEAATRLDDAVKIRDSFDAAVDVTTLDDWIARYREYDAALTELYSALTASGDTVTAAVRAAYRREEAARAALPTDRRALEVIVVDIGRAGLNQAVIGIEQARGSLLLALEALATPDEGDPGD